MLIITKAKSTQLIDNEQNEQCNRNEQNKRYTKNSLSYYQYMGRE